MGSGFGNLPNASGKLSIIVPLQACLRSRDAFWDVQVPKTHSIFDNLLVPRPPCVRAAPPHHRCTRRWLRSTPTMARRRARMLPLLPLWRAARTTGKQSRLAASGDCAPSLRSSWRAAAARRASGRATSPTVCLESLATQPWPSPSHIEPFPLRLRTAISLLMDFYGRPY